MKIEEGKLHYSKITRPYIVQASYVAKKKDGHVVDDVISAWTGALPINYGTPPLSHTERGYYIDGELMFFSSTSRNELGGGNGTRWITGKELLKNSDRWKIQIKPIEEAVIVREISRANSIIPMKYDFIGVVADFLIIFDIVKEANAIYCSKACHFVETGRKRRISPRHRWTYANKKGYFEVTVPDIFRFEVKK